MCRSTAHPGRAGARREGEFVGAMAGKLPLIRNQRQRATEGDACRVWRRTGPKPDKRARATTRGAREGPTTATSLPLGDAVSVAQSRARKRPDRPDATLCGLCGLGPAPSRALLVA